MMSHDIMTVAREGIAKEMGQEGLVIPPPSQEKMSKGQRTINITVLGSTSCPPAVRMYPF